MIKKKIFGLLRKNVKDRMDFILFRVGGGSRVERKKNVGRGRVEISIITLDKENERDACA